MAPATPERRLMSPPAVTPKTTSPERVDRSYATSSPVKATTPAHARNGLFADYNPSNKSATNLSSFALAQSPTLPDLQSFRSHVRTNSDVQGLVKRFEHLDVRDRDAESQERRRKHEAELRRAQIAREEAETDVKRLRAELRALKKEHDDSRERERKVGKRLEVVMEEYANAKEAHAAGSGVYEKELRKIRKEAFKSSSTVVKLQEELKSARNSLRVTQAALDMEKQKVQRREQETFDAQYQFVALQEELEKLKAQLQTVQEEKEALKTNLREEEVARIAAEGMIALPISQDADDDLATSPRKASPSKLRSNLSSEDKENMHVVPRRMVEYKRLEEDLAREQRRREHAEEMCDFLNMECTFQCCSCKSTTRRDTHNDVESITADFRRLLEDIRADMVYTMRGAEGRAQDALHDRSSIGEQEMVDVDVAATTQQKPSPPRASAALKKDHIPNDLQATCGDSMNDVEMSVETKVPREDRSMVVVPTSVLVDEDVLVMEDEVSIEAGPQEAATQPATPPRRPSDEAHRNAATFRTVTTTTTIPMQFTPASKAPVVYAADNGENLPPQVEGTTDPPVIDRAAALAAIQYRRGRARSLANGHATPRKQMVDGVSMNERRDVSAPTLGMKTGANAVRTLSGSASVGRARSAGRKV